MKPSLEQKYTRYEIARILGARSLQLAMDAPVLLKISDEELEEINHDVLRIAEKELESEVLPITVKRPFPKKSEREIKRLSEREIKEKLEIKKEREMKEIDKLEEKKEEIEERDEKEIIKEGEIMEMAIPEDEDSLEEEDIKEDI